MLMMKHRCFIKNTHIRRVAKRERRTLIALLKEEKERKSIVLVYFFFFLLRIRSIDWNRTGTREDGKQRKTIITRPVNIFFPFSLSLRFFFSSSTHIQNTSTSIIIHKRSELIFLLKESK